MNEITRKLPAHKQGHFYSMCHRARKTHICGEGASNSQLLHMQSKCTYTRIEFPMYICICITVYIDKTFQCKTYTHTLARYLHRNIHDFPIHLFAGQDL